MKKSNLIISLLAISLLTGCGGTAATETVATQSLPTDATSEITEAPVIEELQISHKPGKLIYVEGETFDATGLTVDALLSDGSVQKNIAYTIDEEGQALKPAQKAVTVSYGEEYIKLAITVRYAGNVDCYSVAETPELEVKPLENKTFFFLGSSVTFGANSEGESMAEFIAKRQHAIPLKKPFPEQP